MTQRGHAKRFCASSAGLFRDGAGAQEGMSSASLDADHGATLTPASVQMQRAMLVGTIASGYVHDLNTLLMVTDLCAYTAIGGLPEDHPARRELELLRAANDSAREMASRLLAFVRRQPPAPRPIELRRHLEGSMPMYVRLLGHQVRMSFEVAPDLWGVIAEPTQIDQIMLNLLVNARTATARAGRVTVSAQNVHAGEAAGLAPGEYICLTVADTGVGMGPHTLERLFEPFLSADLLGEGSGLGLATCCYLARQLGGGISVESALGAGTTFQVYLPRADGGSSVERGGGTARPRAD